MPGPKQTDFGAGEISPLLHAKTGEAFYARGAKALTSFLVSKEGAAVSRPGTTYVGDVKHSPLFGGFVAPGDEELDHCVLVPFNAADDESFSLLFGVGYIRFISRGGYVLSGGVPYEVVTPYTADDLPNLHWAQFGEVLTVVCPNWDAYELRHVSDVPPSWTFTAAITAPLSLGSSVDSDVFFCDVNDLTTLTSEFMVKTSTIPVADASHPAREWIWLVTAIVRDNATNELRETLPVQVTQKYETDPDLPAPLGTNTLALYPDKAITLQRGVSSGLLGVDAAATIVAYNFYRGRGALFGFIGQTTSRQFVDVGDAPDLNHQPPVGTNPFGNTGTATAAAAPFNVIRDDRAQAITYFESRRLFGGLTRHEADFVASALGDFDNFDERKLFHITGESVVYTIASRRRGRIRHLVTMERCLALTSAAAYAAGGQPSTTGLDFDSVWVPLIEEVGANMVTPAVVDGVCFFARAKGRGLRGIGPGQSVSGFKGFDASMYAEHLFRGVGRNIVSMSYAEDPWGVLWVVREDGVLLSFTFDGARQMLAWSKHEFDGEVESVCAVPEGDEDAVYLVVARTINGLVHRFVERMTARHERGGAVLELDGANITIETPPDYICVDCASPFIGDPGVSYTVITGLSHLEGKAVWVLGQGLTPAGPFTVSGGQVSLDFTLAPNITGAPGGDRALVYVGLPYIPRLELLPVAGGDRTAMKQVTHISFEVDNARGIKVAQDDNTLDDQPDRDVQDGFGTQPLRTEVVRVPVRGTWDYSAGMVLEQSLPLPVTVIGLSRNVVGGDG